MRLMIVVATLLLSACATKPVAMNSAIPVPADRIVGTSFLQPDEKRTEQVTVTRDRGFMGSAINMLVSVNSDPIAALDTGEMVTFYLAPGRYVFVAQGKPNLLNEAPGETEVHVVDEQSNRFRLRLVPGDGARFEKTVQP